MASFNKSLSDVRDTVFTYFSSEWNDLTPITYDNIDHYITFNTDWVRISLRATNPSVSAIGQKNFRFKGIIFIQIFTVANNSTMNNDTYINLIIEKFSQIQLENYITLRDTEINGYNISQDTNGVYYQTNMSVQFYYDVVRT
jgi:hypothetical protein